MNSGGEPPERIRVERQELEAALTALVTLCAEWRRVRGGWEESGRQLRALGAEIRATRALIHDLTLGLVPGDPQPGQENAGLPPPAEPGGYDRKGW